MSVLSHSGYETLRHFEGHRHFARGQRLRLETSSWRVLDFEGNPFLEGEIERQQERFLLVALVVRDREYAFRGELIPDASGNVDPQLPMLANVSCLLDAPQLCGSYELVQKLWQRFVLTASRINVTVAWPRDEVLVSSVSSPDCRLQEWILNCINFYFLVLVSSSEGDASAHSNTCCRLGENTSAVRCGTRNLGLFNLGFDKHVEID